MGDGGSSEVTCPQGACRLAGKALPHRTRCGRTVSPIS